MIGILGGTFDPIHNGHLHIATQVSARLRLEQMQFMPCALPVHRDRPQASTADRCAMINLAIAGISNFALNTLELERGGPSYTIDSLRRMHRHTDSILVLVLGAVWGAQKNLLHRHPLEYLVVPGAVWGSQNLLHHHPRLEYCLVLVPPRPRRGSQNLLHHHPLEYVVAPRLV